MQGTLFTFYVIFTRILSYKLVARDSTLRPYKREPDMPTSIFTARESAILDRLIAKAGKATSKPVEASKLAQATTAYPEQQKSLRKASSGLKLAADLLPMASTLDELPDCLSW